MDPVDSCDGFGNAWTASKQARELVPIDPILVTALSTNVSDRQFVLETELLVCQFLSQRTKRLSFSKQNSYRRLLLHKLADYYELTHVVVGQHRDEIAFYKNLETEVVQPVSLGEQVELLDDAEGVEQGGEEEEVGFTRILVKKSERGLAGSTGRLVGAQSAGVRPGISIEERQAAYERARAEIFQDDVTDSVRQSRPDQTSSR
ncbi:hypothetical protein GGH19_004978 [Coemansia sp. RSA 1807]|nr:hypothetical protein LPJ62_003592 [Coemansia sp. RSA 2167]KAJ2146837.1 hypothetical protein IW142_001903 [Coemansia sp. RSA 564]KAJ2153019.1 hypothetical protein GGH16_006014 [Coemansia sp. RSA 560]KAJ2202271.1 hypothetical protein IW143_006158 [Coemansia sp. RSA 520]KAJ2571191.1 hypothetical protein GGH19_004978 [Coemansia sp. RSA 1807]